MTGVARRVIVLINPNTNAATTAMLAANAARHLHALGVNDLISVQAVSVATGPAVIVDPTGLRNAAAAVLACAAKTITDETIAVIVGAIGDPGVDELRRAIAIPVIGIGEASMAAAARGGRRFGIVTTTPLLTGLLQQLAERFGSEGTFTGVRLTDSSATMLADDPHRQLQELSRACQLCQETDRAEAVVIGGGPLSDSARSLSDNLDMAVVQPLPAAIDLALALSATDAVRPMF